MTNRRKLQLISATLAVGAITLLSACDPDKDDTGSASTADTQALVTDRVNAAPAPTIAPAPTVENTGSAMELAFIVTLDNRGIYYPSEGEAIDLGMQICDTFDAGASFLDVMGVMIESDYYSAEDGGFFVGVSIGAFCPEHESEIPGN